MLDDDVKDEAVEVVKEPRLFCCWCFEIAAIDVADSLRGGAAAELFLREVATGERGGRSLSTLTVAEELLTVCSEAAALVSSVVEEEVTTAADWRRSSLISLKVDVDSVMVEAELSFLAPLVNRDEMAATLLRDPVAMTFRSL